MAACQDIYKLTGVDILGFHFSEPGQGKHICDWIICPMKAALKKFGDEGNNILNANDIENSFERETSSQNYSICLQNKRSEEFLRDKESETI